LYCFWKVYQCTAIFKVRFKASLGLSYLRTPRHLIGSDNQGSHNN